MELKNALSVCLISLFSATLVMLIARSLDSQAASRLEPQLARIVKELEALRSSGGFTGTGVTPTNGASLQQDGLVAYYFHGNIRCPTCRAIESQSHATVESDFAAELDRGALTWKILNYEDARSADLAKKFEVQMPVVVLARMQQGEIQDWKRLDQVWALVGDKPAFAQYIGSEVRGMLEASEPQTDSAGPGDLAPSTVITDDGPNELPLPEDNNLLLP